MINFQDIKTELVETGLAYQNDVDAATETVVVVDGQWNRDGSATITSTQAGWVVAGLLKVVPTKFDVPATSKFDKEGIKSALQQQFPGSRVIVRIV